MRFDAPFARLDNSVRRDLRARVEALLDEGRTLWVFGYGSLMWRPCFPVAERRRAVAQDVRRSLCIWTVEARGTPANPGLGLGLVRAIGQRCAGVVDRVSESDRAVALSALWERELLTGIYVPRFVRISDAGDVSEALAFVVDPSHPQYCGERCVDEQATMVANAHGTLGSCLDYLRATVDALATFDIDDEALTAVLARAEALSAQRLGQ